VNYQNSIARNDDIGARTSTCRAGSMLRENKVPRMRNVDLRSLGKSYQASVKCFRELCRIKWSLWKQRLNGLAEDKLRRCIKKLGNTDPVNTLAIIHHSQDSLTSLLNRGCKSTVLPSLGIRAKSRPTWISKFSRSAISARLNVGLIIARACFHF
jgi:hypothetical protein